MKSAPEPSPSIPLRERSAAIDLLHRAQLGCAGVMLFVALALPALLAKPSTITTYFYFGDTVWLAGIAVFVALTAIIAPPARSSLWFRLDGAQTPRVWAIAGLVAIVALSGTACVFHGTPISYDEVMADFDARIFLGGRLIAPLSPEWRHNVTALAPNFVLPVPNDAAWSSSYLPVNAAFRAGFAWLGSPALTGPVLAAIAVLAVAGVARRLWPERPDAAIVAALMMATSPQVVVTAMTPYAMTAHLALNLVWLWLFLLGGRLGHGGALLIAFLACGLHQLIFHPLFAAPFLIGLLVARRWRLSAVYLAGYALIGAFWTLYWQGVLEIAGVAASEANTTVGAGYMVSKLTFLLRNFDIRGLDVMAMNLVRFVAWQSPLLLPLIVLAIPAIRRGTLLMRALAGGVALTIVAMFVLLPFQGHGWGYRYLHGLIGSVCLLAAQGWVDLTRTLEPQRRAAAAAILGLGWMAAGLILIPGRSLEAERFAAPYVRAVAAIERDPADTIFVDAHALVYGADLVRNDPYLRHGRAVVMLQGLSPDRLATLCAKGNAAWFSSAEGARIGLSGAGTIPASLPAACSVRPVQVH